MEVKLGGMVIKTGTNGSVEWEMNPSQPETLKIVKHKESNTVELFSEGLMRYKKEKSKLEYLSRVYIGKQLCHQIVLTRNTGQQFVFCLNTKTFALVKKLNKDTKNTIYSLNYEKTGKYLLPKMFCKITPDGAKVTFKVNKYIFNKPIDEQLFELPKKKK